jgi:hypothetical protein
LTNRVGSARSNVGPRFPRRALRKLHHRHQKLGRVLFLVAPLIALQSLNSFAQNIPKALMGKSIIIDWDEHRVLRNIDRNGDFHENEANVQTRLYLSQNGHVFSRLKIELAGDVGIREHVSSEATNARIATFTGSSMSFTIPMGVNNSGIRHIDISFGPKFQECSAKVHIARAPAAAQWLTKSMVGRSDGNLLEIKSMDATQETCKMMDGNVFDGSS